MVEVVFCREVGFKGKVFGRARLNLVGVAWRYPTSLGQKFEAI